MVPGCDVGSNNVASLQEHLETKEITHPMVQISPDSTTPEKRRESMLKLWYNNINSTFQ